MSRKDKFAFIDVNSETQGDIAYCKNCKRAGLQIKYGDLIQEEGKELPSDADDWCQCPRCGDKQPIYNREVEGGYSFPFDIVENPFDSGSQFEGIGKRKKHNRLNDYNDKL